MNLGLHPGALPRHLSALARLATGHAGAAKVLARKVWPGRPEALGDEEACALAARYAEASALVGWADAATGAWSRARWIGVLVARHPQAVLETLEREAWIESGPTREQLAVRELLDHEDGTIRERALRLVSERG